MHSRWGHKHAASRENPISYPLGRKSETSSLKVKLASQMIYLIRPEGLKLN